MKKTIIAVLLLALSLFLLFTVGVEMLEEEQAEAKTAQIFSVVVIPNAAASASNPVRSPVPSPKKIVAKAPQKPKVKDLPLPEEVSDYLWKKSRESGFSYYLLLAIAQQESNFDTTSVSKTGDYGLLQINKRTAKGIAAKLDLKKYNLMDYKTSIDFSLYHLSGLRAYWDKKGYKGKSLERMILLSYNRGVAGAKRYVKKHGRTSAYVSNIQKYKKQIETRRAI